MTLRSEPSRVARHRAVEPEGEFRIAAPEDLLRTGRHAEPAFARGVFDPRVDEDPFDWLGFGSGAA